MAPSDPCRVLVLLAVLAKINSPGASAVPASSEPSMASAAASALTMSPGTTIAVGDHRHASRTTSPSASKIAVITRRRPTGHHPRRADRPGCRLSPRRLRRGAAAAGLVATLPPTTSTRSPTSGLEFALCQRAPTGCARARCPRPARRPRSTNIIGAHPGIAADADGRPTVAGRRCP